MQEYAGRTNAKTNGRTTPTVTLCYARATNLCTGRSAMATEYYDIGAPASVEALPEDQTIPFEKLTERQRRQQQQNYAS